jgi:hypothetical protein
VFSLLEILDYCQTGLGSPCEQTAKEKPPCLRELRRYCPNCDALRAVNIGHGQLK